MFKQLLRNSILTTILLAICTNTLVYGAYKFNNQISTLEVTFSIKLTDGMYGDFDNDTNVDDVSCLLHIYADSSTYRKTASFDVNLTLPNGDSYSYSFLLNTIYDSLTLQLLFINHAYVTGDYIIIAEALLLGQGVYSAKYDIIFDPPTEQIPDDEPFLVVESV